jgi:hypothetical protein
MSTGGSHPTDSEDGHVSLFAAISECSVAGASDCGDEIGMFTFPGVSPWGSGEIHRIINHLGLPYKCYLLYISSFIAMSLRQD